MRYTSDFRLGPERTPKVIRQLIIYTILISIAASLGSTFFSLLFETSGPEEWLSLSWNGLTSYFIWQPVSYLFVQYTAGQGITLSYLFNLLIQMYALWIFGSQVFERIDKKPFLQLYFISGILAGIITLLLMRLVGNYAILSGPTTAILAVFVVWALMYPEIELLLFFLIPIQAKWLAVGLLGVIFLISLSSLNFVNFTYYFISCLIGYLYGLIMWELRNPFPGFYRKETYILEWSLKIGRFSPLKLRFPKKSSESAKPKVFDISTGEIKLDDDSFVNAMLEKISKKGEQSLSWKERRRMEEISEQKRQEKGRKH